MAMEVQGSRRHQDAGVKVKFIETRFISSDAASFKAVVQRLTGKSSSLAASPPPAPQPRRPHPCRPAFAGAGQQQAAAGWPEQHHTLMTVPAPKQEPLAAAAPRLDEMHELCDFADLFYTTATAGARHDDAGSAFPY
ncbi:hypothetical protein SEVIR_4G137500v4 [Setaria viridis]|uniref:VQ domain-containing protein n=1 Tax=Setaria viridis TaxID=4556 RepID=A0A4U6VCJ5_SETVI|nr:uncharacterized protein LOC117853122 [Setaria viridis]TKW21697.1 hypothetical protein SEVIR_4G137500v2 [Setaria viridis]